MTAYRALARAHFLAFLRDKASLFFTFAFPLVFILIFGLLFGSRSTPGGGRVIDSLAPGVMAWGVGNGAVFGVAYTLMHWRRNDVLRLVRMSPVPLPTVLAARFAVVLGVGIVQAVLFIAVATLPVFGLTVSAGGILLSLPVLVLGILTFFAVGLLVGNYANTPDGVAAVANCLMIPMAFLSGSFFPLSSSPGWLQGFSRVLPLRYMNDGFDKVLTGTHGAASLLGPCTGLLVFAVIFATLAVRTFKWSAES
ncbi:ABC transporter [Streptomyces eurocidicus]|uniref:Transport permease protein n=1 Tax=Streptomyces eurocidicus TaxID=66423 RepID=A0A2N8P0Z7_STREU|nr:ABC transporter permease [Streptomyces eurocidicus]MBB5121809.1 ABC-2 type transport system permease protein [Streptomyces eurocidicus]MBF6055075.1 ABC transporter permease [Streptomyces eurocidicus]PNE34679.1 ABC transporter [Streptomyces eurocidicus]